MGGSRRRGLSQEARGEERCRTLKRTHVRAGLEREERKPFDEDTKHSVMNHLAQTRCVGSISATSSVARAPRVQSLAFRASQGVQGRNLNLSAFPRTAAAGSSVTETTCRVKLRFKRMGRKKRPFYRLVAIDSRRKREGLALEELGWYNPLTKETYINAESVQKWLAEGAEPSDTVASLLKKAMPAFNEN